MLCVGDLVVSAPATPHTTFKLDSARMSREDSEAITVLNTVFRELQLPSIQDLQDRHNSL